MATEDVKAYLEETLGIPEKQWKRVSKKTLDDGTEVRVFRNKKDGFEVETHETVDGEIRFQHKVIVANNPQTVDVIQRFYRGEEVDVATLPDLASHFTFCFSANANTDHDMTMELLVEAFEEGEIPNPLYVTGFNLLIIPHYQVQSIYTHNSHLIGHLLPSYLTEVEESTFCIHPESSMIYGGEREEALEEGTIPRVTYQELVQTLEKAGFVYDANSCMLGVFASLTRTHPSSLDP